MAQFNNQHISVLGSGCFGMHLAKALVTCGYDVVLGSRNPLNRSATIDSLNVVDVKQCVESGEIIFVALKAEDMMYTLRPYKKELENKILVDVSNGVNNQGSVSTAEQLALEFLNCTVVKAFNSISAYDLDIAMQHRDQTVSIASESVEANAKIAVIAHNLGFSIMCYKSLKYARTLEQQQLSYLGTWGKPCAISLCIFFIWLIYSTLRHHVTKGKPFSMWPMNTMNKIIGATASTIFPLCYLPGSIVLIYKLVKKSRHVTLPEWLMSWIEMRQKLGLIALWLVAFHCLLSISQISPAYFSKWYQKYKYTIPANMTTDLSLVMSLKMAWYGELCIFLGLLAFCLMAVVGLTSVPSIGSRMTRRQWKLVHTYMGHTCVVISVAHVLTKQAASWGLSPLKDLMQGISVVSLWVPCLALLLRVVTTVTSAIQTCCCSIREERNYSEEKELEKLDV